MRILLMISNQNMGIRDTYTSVLKRDFPGWGMSHMSGLPSDPTSIIGGFDAVIYEMFVADDPRQYKGAKALWSELKIGHTTPLITHVEGPYRDASASDLRADGVTIVGTPFNAASVSLAFQSISPVRQTQAPLWRRRFWSKQS